MNKPMRDIVILDGQWLRIEGYKLDLSYNNWPVYDSGPVWYQQPIINVAVLSYVKRDGVAHAVRIYGADLSRRKSGRMVMRYSTTPTPDNQPVFTVTSQVAQAEYDAMHSEIDEIEWSV